MILECKKLFIRKKAWLLLLIFTALRVLTAVTQRNYAADYRPEIYRDAYMQHMEILEGPLTDEKAAYIDGQNDLIRRMKRGGNDADIQQYISGEIDEETFNARFRSRRAADRREDEFAVINERYQSVKQNPERVYFMYSNGWVGLLGNEHFDFVLLILLMWLTVPTVCDEFSTGMYPLLRTTPNGGARLFAAKAAAASLAAVLSAVLMFAAEAGFYAAVMGLPDGSFPLQSLPPFAESPFQLSIFGAAMLTLLHHCIGALFVTALLLCLSAIFRRALSAVFVGSACLLLPYFLLAKRVEKYLLPTPLGFLFSCGWIQGRFPVEPYSQEYVTVTQTQYRHVLLASAGIIALLLLIGTAAYAGISLPRRRKVKLSAVCMLLLLLTGCGEKPAESPGLDGLVYDKWRYQPVCEAFAVVRDENDSPCLSCKDSGALVPLVHDCFTEGAQQPFSAARLCYIDGDTVYYLIQHSMWHYEIIALDTRDFSEKSVHSAYWSDNLDKPDKLFGLGARLPSSAPQDETVDSFFVYHGQLILSKSAGIFCVDLASGAVTGIYEGKAENLAATNGYVFFLDDVLDLYRWDIRTGQTERVPVGKVERRFYAVEDGLYYKDLKDSAFYFVKPDGSGKTLLPDFDEEAWLRGE